MKSFLLKYRRDVEIKIKEILFCFWIIEELSTIWQDSKTLLMFLKIKYAILYSIYTYNWSTRHIFERWRIVQRIPNSFEMSLLSSLPKMSPLFVCCCAWVKLWCLILAVGFPRQVAVSWLLQELLCCPGSVGVFLQGLAAIFWTRIGVEVRARVVTPWIFRS